MDPRYNALVAIWPSLSTWASTDLKLTALNSMTITGTIPASTVISGTQVLNCISWPEFNAISTASLRAELLELCNNPGSMLGGTSNTTHMLPGMLLANFTVGSVTIANLTNLAKNQATLWWQTTVANGGGGLSSPVGQADLIAAGGLT